MSHRQPLPQRFAERTFVVTFLAVVLAISRPAHASLTVLIGEPFGPFGTMMPVGHTALYLDHLCADGPLRIRQCHPGEPQGVAIARYHRIGQTDWIASPILQFLYASSTPDQVPTFVTPQIAWDRRQAYRAQFLQSLVPDGTERQKATDEWWETAGVAFNRRLWGYRVNTTPAQDAALIHYLDDAPNHHLYHLRRTNCANFAQQIVNFYFPAAVTQDKIADFGLMTPKQVARALTTYATAHPELELQVLEIPQLPGTLRRSRPIRGASEAGLKTKRYLATLLILQPEVPLILTALYLDHGRWQIGHNATPVTPQDFLQTDTTQATASPQDPTQSTLQ